MKYSLSLRHLTKCTNLKMSDLMYHEVKSVPVCGTIVPHVAAVFAINILIFSGCGRVRFVVRVWNKKNGENCR